MSHAEELGRLRAQLGELLALLDDEHAEPVSLARAMHSCSLVFEALEAGFPTLEDLEAEQRARLASELARALRLNAAALDRAAGEPAAAGAGERA